MRSYPIPVRLAFPTVLLLLSSCLAVANGDGQAPDVGVDVNLQSQPADQNDLPPLDQLVAPVALYPDPLLSLMLPASTYPDQVQQASSFLQQGGSPSQIGSMNWDSSVQGLAHYPDVIQWMAGNPDWTTQLGGAFANQPASVMDAVQDLRRRAQAVGSLVSTPQQRVLVNDGEVEIEPAQAQMIYVPQYDPAVVYVSQAPGFYSEPVFGWSEPYPTGVWMTFDFDWRNHGVYQGDWYTYHMQHGGWDRPVDYSHFRNEGAMNHGYSNWRAPRNAPAAPPQLSARGSGTAAASRERFAQPAVIAGTPRAPANAARVNSLAANRNERPGAATPASTGRNQPEMGARAVNETRQAQAPAANQERANARASATTSEQRPLSPEERSMQPAAGRTAAQSPSATNRTVTEPKGETQAERSYEPQPARNPGAEERPLASGRPAMEQKAPAPQERSVEQPARSPETEARPLASGHPAMEQKAPSSQERTVEQPSRQDGGAMQPSSAARPEPSRQAPAAHAQGEAAKAKPAPEQQPEKPKDQDNPPK